MIASTAGSIASFLSRKPSWLSMQRYLMGSVLTGLALRMAMEARK
jgi:threonine/homoserine/homoserine lactone efflux protein